MDPATVRVQEYRSVQSGGQSIQRERIERVQKSGAGNVRAAPIYRKAEPISGGFSQVLLERLHKR